ncbi:unnamed protein product [Rotaria sp. Silwood2]|nr:unnamed protein product [Rotaria sp. Silwood2]
MYDEFPWEDEDDYDNFVSNPSARDIIVPQEAGCKPIIELLLKKNPEQRSSAEETLIKLKQHPLFGVIVETLEKKYYPVDDVLRDFSGGKLEKKYSSSRNISGLTITDDLKEEMNRIMSTGLPRTNETQDLFNKETYPTVGCCSISYFDLSKIQ